MSSGAAAQADDEVDYVYLVIMLRVKSQVAERAGISLTLLLVCASYYQFSASLRTLGASRL